MIFRQIAELRDGRKTQTRRVAKPNETFAPNDQRAVVSWKGARMTTKWRVDHTYAIVPKRGAPAAWVNAQGQVYSGEVRNAAELDAAGWFREHIRITGIRFERLQDISEADARAEGVADVAEYRDLWESINGAGSWDANPIVWVLKFCYCCPF